MRSHTFALAAVLAFVLQGTLGRPDAPPSPPATKKPAKPPATSASAKAASKSDPLAQRLCDALHTVPAARKGECCGTSPASLAGLCAGELTASLGRGAVSLDAAGIDHCAEGTARELEGCAWVTPLLPRLPDACRGVVHGKLKSGAACRSSLECPDGLYCRGASSGRAGVCSAPAAPRTRCEVPLDSLAGYARAKDDPRHPECDGRCVKGHCVPFVLAGGPCQSSAICSPGLHCVAGRCEDRPLPKVGESCSGGTSCGPDGFCDAGRCAPRKDAGETCALPFECRALECSKAPGAKTGTCGEPCGPGAPKRR